MLPIGDASPRFEILGRPAAWRDGRELDLGPGKQRAVLAVLLLTPNRPVPTPSIVDAVWGDGPPDNGANVVQKYVAGLRRVLEPGRSPRSPGRLLTLTGAGYALHVPRGGLDADVFQDRVKEALAVRATGDAARAANLLRDALDLWRGPALAGLTGTFFDAARDRLDEERAAALEASAEIGLDLAEHARLVPELIRLVAEFPLREGFRYLLMLALYRSGRQAEALAAYRDARDHFAEEFGSEPGERLQTLHIGILRSDPALAPPPAPGSANLPAPGPALTDLPVPGTGPGDLPVPEATAGVGIPAAGAGGAGRAAPGAGGVGRAAPGAGGAAFPAAGLGGATGPAAGMGEAFRPAAGAEFPASGVRRVSDGVELVGGGGVSVPGVRLPHGAQGFAPPDPRPAAPERAMHVDPVGAVSVPSWPSYAGPVMGAPGYSTVPPGWEPPARPAKRRVPWPARVFLAFVPLLSFGFATWAVLAYFAVRRRSRWLALASAVQLVLAITFFGTVAAMDLEQSSWWDLPMMLSLLGTTVGGVVHLALLTAEPWSPETDGGPAAVAVIEQRVRREQARSLVAHHPQVARHLRIGRPDLARTFDDGGLIDVNTAPEHLLAALPGLDPSLAKLIVLARMAQGPLASVDDLVTWQILPFQTLHAVRETLIAVPPHEAPEGTAPTGA